MREYQRTELADAHKQWAKECLLALNELGAKKAVGEDYLTNILEVRWGDAVFFSNGANRMMHAYGNIDGVRHEVVVLLLRVLEGSTVMRLHYVFKKDKLGMQFVMSPHNSVADACFAEALYDNIVFPVLQDSGSAAEQWTEFWF